MNTKRPINITLNLLLIVSILSVLSLIIFLQCINPYLYECDGYYHIKEPYFLRQLGIHREFPWTQFCTFKKCFGDKEFLFHILILPFTFIGNDIHPQARMAVTFFALLLLIVFVFIQRKYVLKPLLIFSVLSLPLSILFLTYINYLRPKTIAITLILLLIYFLIERKWTGALLISLLYPSTHISCLVIPILALGIETMRYLHSKEFFVRNFVYSTAGLLVGIYIHPNFPNNVLSLHLNAIYVPWNTMLGTLRLNYGLEWNPANTQIVLLDSLIFFVGLFFALTILIVKRPKIGFHTIAFFFATSFFLFFSMFSLCYWYFTYPLGIIFLGMFFSDWLKLKAQDTSPLYKHRKWNKSILLRVALIFVIGVILSLRIVIIKKQDGITGALIGHIDRNSHYERMGNWMNEHIPEGETIYHTSWSDSPYFICLNPKDYYLTMLDPIYMYFYSKEIYTIYETLSNGGCNRPCRMLRKIFKTKYVYTGKGYGLYRQLKERPEKCKILFEDDYGAIIQLAGKEKFEIPTPKQGKKTSEPPKSTKTKDKIKTHKTISPRLKK